MAAIIRSLRNGLIPITGASRDDLRAGDVVTVNSVDAATTYAWTLAYKPEGSTAVFSGSAVAPSPGSFTVDKEGPYLVRLTVNLGLPSENTQFVRLRFLTVLGDLKLVAAGEQYGGTIPVPVDASAVGWADEQNFNIMSLLGLIAPMATSGRVFYVDANLGTEGYGNFDSIQDAIDEAVTQGASALTPWAVLARPGVYQEDVTFRPHVYVLAWPGSAEVGNGVIIQAGGGGSSGSHTIATPNPGDVIFLYDLTVQNTLGTPTDAAVVKVGTGTVVARRCSFKQLGVSATIGAGFDLRAGFGQFTDCQFTAPNSGFLSRLALLQSGGTGQYERCLVLGTSGAYFSGGQATLTDCRLLATGAAGATSLQSDAPSLTLNYCRVESPAGADALNIHPSGGALPGNVEATLRWTFVDGNISFDVTGIVGNTTLNIGSCEYGSLVFPGGSPTTFAATTKSKSLFYDNSITGITATNVQDAIDEVAVLATAVRTLDDAYDAGLGAGGGGRRIIADSGAVEVVDALPPSDPPTPANPDGRFRATGGVEVGAIGRPEIDLDPNHYGNGPAIRMGQAVWANNAPHGSTAFLMARSTGAPLFRNYNLRVQTESADGGGSVGWLILRGGDGLVSGLGVDGGPIYLQAGSGLDPAGGDGGNVYILPGGSAAGVPGLIVFANPVGGTGASLTAAGPFVGGVTGTIRFATDMGGIAVNILAGDGLLAVLGKFNATGQVVATQLAGVITLTTLSLGPTAEIFFLNDTVGNALDTALGVFAGQVQVNGTWPLTLNAQVTAPNEISFGIGGASGPLIYNADTGKLTLPGVLDPTAAVFTEAPPPTVSPTQGGIFVSDGSGGLTVGALYYRTPGGVSDINLSGGAAGLLDIRDEGVSLGLFNTMDLRGTGVQGYNIGGIAAIYIPPPAFDSHWNTSDGGNGNQAVTESISRTTAHISTPNGGEGTPFKTGGWATTDHPASLQTTSTFTTPSTTTGFGGDSTMTVEVYDADGVTLLDSYTTPAITGNAIHTSPSTRLVVTITSYGADAFRFKAKASVAVDIGGVFSDNVLDGGRYHVVVTHTPDSTTDGTGPYTFTQTDVFLDTNPTTPSISGLVTIGETGGGVLTKHLSGIEYYILGSQFTAAVTGIDQLNRNTSRTSGNLRLVGTEYGLPILDHCPFGVGAGNFGGWTNNENVNGVTYSYNAWAITTASYRFIAATGNISSFPRDSWADGATVNSPDSAILVDTYTTSSTDLAEYFDDEARRQDSGYNGGTSPGNWVSTASLLAGEALVQNSLMMVPNTSTPTANWTTYKPNVGGANPNYTALGAPVSHYRTIVDTTGLNRASFQVVFTGTFVTNATADLAAGNLEIYVRRRASAGGGNTGPACPPLLLHGALYNFATFDDGATDGHIREASSSGNTVNATFGGYSCETGFFIEVKIINPTIKINSYTVTFF